MAPQKESVDLYRYIRLVLLGGLIVSLALMIAGLVSASMQGLTEVAVLSPWEAILSTLRLEPSGQLNLGILLLLATPVLRVGAALILFQVNQDVRYVIISLAVLSILAISFYVAAG